jgi:tetratricopeptide (TPR) repeat protein
MSNSFQRGNLEFSNKNYEDAEKLYLEDIKTYGEDINTLFNLGNTYLKLDRQADALYYFYKARLLSPGDLSIKKEIQIIEESLELSGQYRYFFPVSKNVLILTALFSVMLLSIVISIISILYYLNKTNNLFYKLKKISISSLGIIILVLSISFIYFEIEKNSGIILTSSDISISPYLGSDSSFKINDGVKIKIKDKFEKYLFITDKEGRYGWIEDKNIGILWE